MLGGEEGCSSKEEASQAEVEQGAPSWMQDEHGECSSEEEQASSRDDDRGPAPERKQIVVDQEGQRGLTELNEAVGQGWRLVQISLDHSRDQQATSGRGAKRFIAVLEQESPQSLFDFGTP